MRIPVFAFFVFATAGFALAADDTSLSGNWQVDSAAGGSQSRQACALTQKANELTGTCNSERGTVELKGKVDGKNVTWTYKTDSPGGLVTVVYKGTIDSADKMAGTLLAVEYSVEGEFTATRSK
jgi:hypothetical protein